MKFKQLIDRISNMLTLDVDVEVDPLHYEHLFRDCVYVLAYMEEEALKSAYNFEVLWIKASFEWDDFNHEYKPVLCVTLKK